MAKKEEKKKPKNLDDFLKSMETEHSKSLDDAFKAHDEFIKDENQNHLYNNIFVPAQDGLYNTLVKELDKSFDKKDETKLDKEEHHKKVKKAVNKALRAYFEKTNPHVIKLIDDLKMSEEDQYERLTSLYDDHIGVGKLKDVDSLKQGIEDLLKKGKTIGHIKKYTYERKAMNLDSAIKLLQHNYRTHQFGKYQPTQIAAYLKPKLEQSGYEIKDKLGYATASMEELVGLRKAAIEKEIHPYLKKKEEKKK